MKTLLSFLAAALLLPLASCSSTPPAALDEGFSYSPVSQREASKLRRAFRHCATLEMLDHHDCTTPATTWRCKVRRGKELDAILARLAAVPQWYDQQYDGPPWDFFCCDEIRFLDAQGRELLVTSTQTMPFYRDANGQMRVLLSLLPLPCTRTYPS